MIQLPDLPAGSCSRNNIYSKYTFSIVLKTGLYRITCLMASSSEDRDDENWMEEIEIEWTREISDAVDPLTETSHSFGKSVTEFETIELVPENNYVIPKVAEDEYMDEVKIELVREDSTNEVDPLGDFERENDADVYTDRLAELALAHGDSVGNLELESRVLFLDVYGTQTKNIKKRYACKLCDYKSSKRGELHSHCRTHHDEESFQSALHAHLTPQPKGEVRGKLLSQKDLLISPLEIHHREKGHFQNKFSTKKRRKRPFSEMRENVVNDVVNLTEKPYACKSCEYTTCRKYDLKKHEEKHLKKHELNHIVDKPYQCTVCSFKCKRPGYLNIHMAVHSNNRQTRRGKNNKLHECSICHYRTKQAGNLKVHVKTHIDERRFTCAVCQKRFSQAGSLKIHMRVHTGEKPYHCNLCGHGFAQIASREHHEKGCAKNCDICNFKCTKTWDLNEHKKTHSLVRIVRLVPGFNTI